MKQKHITVKVVCQHSGIPHNYRWTIASEKVVCCNLCGFLCTSDILHVSSLILRFMHSFQLFYHLKYHGMSKQTFDLNRIFSMEWEYFRAGLSYIAFDKYARIAVMSPVRMG